jgi:hypothetical protein
MRIKWAEFNICGIKRMAKSLSYKAAERIIRFGTLFLVRKDNFEKHADKSAYYMSKNSHIMRNKVKYTDAKTNHMS